MGDVPEGLDQFIAEGNAAPPMDAGRQMSSDMAPPGLSEFIAPEMRQEKYGTLTEQLKTGVEGFAKGLLSGPVATAAELAIFHNPKEQLAREEANPVTSGISKAAGFIAPAILSAGTSAAARLGVARAAEALPAIAGASKFSQLGALEKVGAGVGSVLSKSGIGGPGAGLVSQIGAGTIKGAFEGALFQGGEEASKAFLEDPKAMSHNAIADIGLATVLGGLTGGAFSAIFRNSAKAAQELAPKFVSGADRAAMEAGDFATSIENSNLIGQEEKNGIISGLREQKPDAKEIIEAANRLGAPVMEGMTSNSKMVQKAEDALINGAPTYSGIKRQKLYQEGYNKAASAVQSAIGQESQYSKAELGNMMQDSIVQKIEQQNAPIKALYDAVRQGTNEVPLEGDILSGVISDIGAMKELRVAPSSAEGQMIKSVVNDLPRQLTVDDIQALKATLNLPRDAPANQQRVVALLRDKLSSLEESSVEAFAKQRPTTPDEAVSIRSLIDQKKAADQAYKPFIGKVQTLAKILGKGTVYGPQDAMNFIKNLQPEDITQRLFTKKSNLLTFFAKEFPEEMQLMRQYQKSQIREAASKTGELSAKTLFNKVGSLEPEIQKVLFSPEELQKLSDAEKYIRSFPQNFNPSGTSGMTVFRAFFENPTIIGSTGLLGANARDFGIERFIKAVGSSPEVRQSSLLAKASISGMNALNRGVKDVFNPSKAMTLASVGSTQSLKKLVDEYGEKPEKMLAMGDNNPVPEYAEEFAGVAARAVQYLNSIKPKTDKKSPLDSKMPVSRAEQSMYDRAVQIAQSPLVVLKSVKDGTLIPQDVIALKTIYPSLYNQMAHKMTSEIINHTAKDKTIPYSTRMSMSLFLGQALDSTMTPQAIVSVQAQHQQQPSQNQTGQGSPRPSQVGMRGLSKIASSQQTPDQARMSERASRSQ